MKCAPSVLAWAPKRPPASRNQGIRSSPVTDKGKKAQPTSNFSEPSFVCFFKVS